jgi:hypothetical protein
MQNKKGGVYMIKYLETYRNNVTGLEISKKEVIRETTIRFTTDTEIETIQVLTNDNFCYEIEGFDKNKKIIFRIIFLTMKKIETKINGNYLKILETKR